MAEMVNAGIHLAIVTNDDHDPARKTMALMGILPYLTHVIGADSGFDGKPSPLAAHYLFEALGVLPEKTMMVGDSATDMLFAENAGIRYRVAIEADRGGEIESLIHADFMIASIDDIKIEIVDLE